MVQNTDDSKIQSGVESVEGNSHDQEIESSLESDTIKVNLQADLLTGRVIP